MLSARMLLKAPPDDPDALPLFVPSRLPAMSNGRRGDGMGCRCSNHCRHGGVNYRADTNWRLTPVLKARRAARQASPRA